jgi:phospholipase C
VRLSLRRLAYDAGSLGEVSLAPGKTRSVRVPIVESHHWYDLLVEGPDGFVRRFAGHVETGKASWSDPAMGQQVSV